MVLSGLNVSPDLSVISIFKKAILVPSFTQSVISFMYNTNKRGQSMEPWGTPGVTGFKEDISLLITTR